MYIVQFTFHVIWLFYRSENGDADSDESTTCFKICKCCTPCYASALCLPCRRLRKLSCCGGTKILADEQTTAATSALHENETKSAQATHSCWKRLSCCNRKSKQAQEKILGEVKRMEEQTMQRTESLANVAKATATEEQNKCSLCLAKLFCCRKTNKVQSSSNDGVNMTADEMDAGCCLCLPCRRKNKEPRAWSERQQDSLMSTEHSPKK